MLARCARARARLGRGTLCWSGLHRVSVSSIKVTRPRGHDMCELCTCQSRSSVLVTVCVSWCVYSVCGSVGPSLSWARRAVLGLEIACIQHHKRPNFLGGSRLSALARAFFDDGGARAQRPFFSAHFSLFTTPGVSAAPFLGA